MLTPAGSSADAITGSYTLAMIQVSYADATVHRYTLDQLNDSRDEMTSYFAKLSNRKLDLEVRVGSATLTGAGQTRGYYWDQCAPEGTEARTPCPPPLLQDAVTSAVANGLDMSGVQGVVIVSPWDGGDITYGPDNVTVDGASMEVQQSWDFEACKPYPDCPQRFSDPDPNFPPPGPSNVYWNGWAHEIGHQIEIESGVRLYGDWNGHPGSYSSGYDLMDSGYPLDESVYGLSRPEIGDKSVFAGWLDAYHVQGIPAPASGTATTVAHLKPMGDPISTSRSDIRGLKLPIYRGVYLTVEARRNVGADSYGTGPGLFDQGIKIDTVHEMADPPEHQIDACDYLEPDGCVRSHADPRWPNCEPPRPNLTRSFPYCWPYELWHPGKTYSDPADNLSVAVGPWDPSTHTYTVTVMRGPSPQHADLSLNQWYSPPSNAAETTDIWVDSSCNGYGTYRYGVRADGTAIGNGDDPCANHPNRVYARVRNIGDAPAEHVVVNFQATDPLGVGIGGRWAGIEFANEGTFPSLASIPPGGVADVWVSWTPEVDRSRISDPSSFAFHSCIRVKMNAVAGEIVTGNQDGDGEQENFDYFQAVVDPGSKRSAKASDLIVEDKVPLVTIDGKGITQPRTYRLAVDSHLPAGGQYEFNNGTPSVTLAPGTTRRIPVKMSIPASAPAGRIYKLNVDAWTDFKDTNAAIPATWPVPGRTHIEGGMVAGATLGLHTVHPTVLELSATEDATHFTAVAGTLEPFVKGEVITLDYVTQFGETVTHRVKVDGAGKFTDTLSKPKGAVTLVRAIYAGTMLNSSALAEVVPTPVLAPPTGRHSSRGGARAA